MKRYIAHITIENETPIRIGSSRVDFIVDMPVLRDWNELPYIPGTSLSGILRKEFDEKEQNEIFGYEEERNKEGRGSKVIISSALLVDENGRVHEEPLLEKSAFLRIFDELPIREHTAINERGVAKDKSKFDEEVLYKGAKFRFAIETEDKDIFEKVLEKFSNPLLRIGGGKSKGFGAFKVEKIEFEEMDLERYSQYSASLNEQLKEKRAIEPAKNKDYFHYKIALQPENTYMFGSGYMDKDADMTYVTESVLDYTVKGLSERKVLIPASSIKGALAHRALFHYNKRHGKDSESGQYDKELVQIFGSKKDDDSGSAGNIIMSDCYLESAQEKIFDHVAIDRFTGGAISGALYQEKCIRSDSFIVEIYVKKDVDDEALKAFEDALKDLSTGLLPLGGNSMKGHGIFLGEVYKDGVKL